MSNIFIEIHVFSKQETLIINKKKIKVAPGEMETVTITPEMLCGMSGNTLSFSIENA